MRKTTLFKQMVLAPEIVQIPSAYDGLSAKVIQHASFKAVHMTGSGSSASILGLPDIGFTAVSEMAEHAKNIVLAVDDLPVIADADTGYGNALNVMRTIREFERAGIVGVHLEDQVTPKRCGHLEGKQLISTEEMVGKVRAAAEAREDPDFMIIARTDAREEFGMDEAIRRANLYAQAGADCIFVESPQTIEEMRAMRARIDAPLLANMVEGGKTPWFTARELQEIGFNLVIYPLSGWMAAASVLGQLMRELKETGTTQNFWKRKGLEMTFPELFEVFDYAKFCDCEARFVKGEERDAALAAAR